MRTSERNRMIKKVLAREFGWKNVRVRGGRGTAYGWVHVDVKVPKGEGKNAEAKVVEILKREGLWDKLGVYYDDTPLASPRKEIIIRAIETEKLKKENGKERKLIYEEEGCRIYKEGSWIWVYFSHKPPQEKIEKLKKDGFRFSRKRVAWYKKAGRC